MSSIFIFPYIIQYSPCFCAPFAAQVYIYIYKMKLSKRIVVYKKHQCPRRLSFLFCGSVQNDVVFGVISVRINIYCSIAHTFCFFSFNCLLQVVSANTSHFLGFAIYILQISLCTSSPYTLPSNRKHIMGGRIILN